MGARINGYSVKSKQHAVIDVKENGMSIKKAAFIYDINRTMLINQLKGYRCESVGRPTLLTMDEESHLSWVNWD